MTNAVALLGSYNHGVNKFPLISLCRGKKTALVHIFFFHMKAKRKKEEKMKEKQEEKERPPRPKTQHEKNDTGLPYGFLLSLSLYSPSFPFLPSSLLLLTSDFSPTDDHHVDRTALVRFPRYVPPAPIQHMSLHLHHLGLGGDSGLGVGNLDAERLGLGEDVDAFP